MISVDDYRSGFVNEHPHFVEGSRVTDFESHYSQNGEDAEKYKSFGKSSCFR